MANPVTYNKHASTFIISVGVACMFVAGYFLIEGLSQFSGNATTRNILIIGGILFQISESLCFVAAAALALHSRIWRGSLFLLGCVLFLFSVAVMTLAQKTALQSGINEAGAIDEKRQHLREQLVSLDRMIESYQYNAEKQSKSIYKDSRALGQDSINRASEIEQQKLDISNQLFALSQQRKETSVDFFNRLEEVTGLPARNSEFYFLVLRSLLIELCGILLMAFGASLRAFAAQNKMHSKGVGGGKSVVLQGEVSISSNDATIERERKDIIENKKVTAKAEKTNSASKRQKPVKKRAVAAQKRSAIEPLAVQNSLLASMPDELEVFDVDAVDLDAEIQFIEDDPQAQQATEHRYSQHIRRLRDSNDGDEMDDIGEEHGNGIMDLFHKGIISSLNREEIITGLKKYNSVEVDKALDVQIKNYISQDESETAES